MMVPCLLVWEGYAETPRAARSIEELRDQLEAHLTQPRFNGAHWSIKIASLDTGQTVFEYHADRLVSPASNSKLYTGALALDQLGPDYRITTPVYASVQPTHGRRLHGDLIVLGRGDPSWRLEAGGTNFWRLFDPFVAVVTNAGIRRITGDIIADATFFRGPPSGASWTVDDMNYYYGAEISAITLMDNTALLRIAPGSREGEPCTLEFLQPHTGLTLENHTITTPSEGPSRLQVTRLAGETTVHVFGAMPVGAETKIEDVPVPRPASWFARGLKEALIRHGVRVKGAPRSVRWPESSALQPDAVLLGEVNSPPLRDLVRDFMKPSQNLETDLVFDHVGELTRSRETPPWQTSEELAVEALHAFLQTNDLPADQLHFDEGSGLSRNNLTSAALTMELLRFMTTHPASNAFLNALPVAGVDGTLRRRMKGTPAEGNLRGKTGTLRWVNALSGYLTTAAQERFVFSLFLNRNVAVPGRSGRMELDDIAVMLARFAGRSDTTLESLHRQEGQLFLPHLSQAPFPHSSRAKGHVYRDEFYPVGEHYSDNTVAIFVPNGFQEKAAVDFVFFFHGWRNSVVRTLSQTGLIEQFARAGKNAILVVPAGPRNVPDSCGGKLEDEGGFTRLVREILTTLHQRGVLSQPDARVGHVILSGHSGGYRVITSILERGGPLANVSEVWLFDALYGRAETFLDWQAHHNGRWLTLYTDDGGTLSETRRAMGILRERSKTPRIIEAKSMAPSDLIAHPVVFIHTDLDHGEVVAKGALFTRFLETSGLHAR